MILHHRSMRRLLTATLGLALGFGFALAAACDKTAPSSPASSEKPHMSKHALTVVGADDKVTVELAIPPSWTTDAADPPSWKADGARLSLAAVSPTGSDDATRITKAIAMQYADPSGATRTAYPDGRVFLSQPEGATLHARMFVPYPGGIVMAVALLSDPSKLASVKAAFETLKLAP